MAWKPGQSGNPAGKKPGTLKEKPYREALRMEIAAAEDFRGLRAIARAHLEKARSGDMPAIKELADRLDGRPAQESNVSIQQRPVRELTTEELMVIAAGGARDKFFFLGKMVDHVVHHLSLAPRKPHPTNARQ